MNPFNSLTSLMSHFRQLKYATKLRYQILSRFNRCVQIFLLKFVLGRVTLTKIRECRWHWGVTGIQFNSD